MLAAELIAIGVFAREPQAATGTIVAAPEQTVVALKAQASTLIADDIPLGAYQWQQDYDPNDTAPRAFSFANLLAENERIATIDMIRMSPAAAALGVMVSSLPLYAPIIDADGGKIVQVYFAVDPDRREDAGFVANGIHLPVSFKVTTDATPPNTYERTGVQVLRQQ